MSGIFGGYAVYVRSVKCVLLQTMCICSFTDDVTDICYVSVWLNVGVTNLLKIVQ